MSLFKIFQLIDIAGFLITGNPIWLLGAQIDGSIDAYIEQKKAKRRARDAYNSSLRDRLEMVDIQPDQPRTIALGRVRAVEGVRRRWVSGANDQKLTMIISLAGHEIDAVEQVYFDDVAVTLDGSGYVTTAPYAKGLLLTMTETFTLDGSGGGVFELTTIPTAGTVLAITKQGEGESESQTALTIVSVVDLYVTVSGGSAGATAYITYSYGETAGTARVRTYLGTASQNIGSDLAAEYPGKITSADKFAGIACLVVDVDYDPDVYPQGRPNVTAVFRGAKVYDPRLDSTAGGSGSHRIATPSTWAWSQNPALCAYHYARHANGWAVPAAEIMPAADVATEAAFCDTSTTFTLRKADDTTDAVTMARYRCDIVVSTAGDPRGAMDEILESMAGRSGWAGGVWKFRAGRMPSSVFAMDQSWLAKRLQDDGTVESGPTLQFSNGVPRDGKVNRITGSCVDADQRYQVLPFPAIEDATLIASEGETYPLEVEYQAVSHIAHAQHLASVAIRRNQAALKVQAQCNLWAYRLELFDVGTLTLPRYAIADKTMEVTGWRWHPTEGVQLTLAEITDAIYSVEAELGGRDPAPNTALPSPWDVETLEDLAVTSGVTALNDGSIVSRARVAWTAAASQSVRAGGRVEIQFRQVTDDEWQSWPEDGGSTSAIIPALRGGVYYVFRARFQSAAPLRVRGRWSDFAIHRVADTPLVGTDGLEDGAASVIEAADQGVGSSSVYLTETDILTLTIDPAGFPLLLSATVSAEGSLSARDVTFALKVNGSAVLTQAYTPVGDSSSPGNPWGMYGAMLQYVVDAPGTGSKTVKLTAIGSHATDGVTIRKCNLYAEVKKK